MLRTRGKTVKSKKEEKTNKVRGTETGLGEKYWGFSINRVIRIMEGHKRTGKKRAL